MPETRQQADEPTEQVIQNYDRKGDWLELTYQWARQLENSNNSRDQLTGKLVGHLLEEVGEQRAINGVFLRALSSASEPGRLSRAALLREFSHATAD